LYISRCRQTCEVASFKNFDNYLTTVIVMTKTESGPFLSGTRCSSPYRERVVVCLVTLFRHCSRRYTDTFHCRRPGRHSAEATRYETSHTSHLPAVSLARSFPNALAASADRSYRTTAVYGSWQWLRRPSLRLQCSAELKTHTHLSILAFLQYSLKRGASLSFTPQFGILLPFSPYVLL